MSQSLPNPVLRGPALGQCCHSVAIIDDVMGRLALLQGYFSLLSGSAPETPANGTARILAGTWTDLRQVRDTLSGMVHEAGGRHV